MSPVLESESFKFQLIELISMNVIQEKMLEYNHGYFMAIGLGVFLIGFVLQVLQVPQVLQPSYYQLLTVLGALVLGYGTGRCDQCTVQEN